MKKENTKANMKDYTVTFDYQEGDFEITKEEIRNEI